MLDMEHSINTSSGDRIVRHHPMPDQVPVWVTQEHELCIIIDNVYNTKLTCYSCRYLP